MQKQPERTQIGWNFCLAGVLASIGVLVVGALVVGALVFLRNWALDMAGVNVLVAWGGALVVGVGALVVGGVVFVYFLIWLTQRL